MKKIILAAMAVCAVFASCSKDNGGKSENDPKYLSIKISGVTQSGLRFIENPGVGTSGTIQLLDGHIFVINPLGAVTHHENLNITEAKGAGQTLGEQVAADSRVYILGNIPSADKATIIDLDTFDAIQAAASAMTTQSDYTKAALANADGLPMPISPVIGTNTATATVVIKPLISRIELAQVKGGANITAFTVTGVYVDDYYPSFTYGGSYTGTKFEQKQSTIFTGIKDEDTWVAAGSPSPLVAIPATDKVWAHNVASGGVPRFIIALTGIEYTKDGNPETLGGTHYLTVTSYTGVTTFERGKIYRIGGVNGITFDEDDLGLTPNPVDIDLLLNVTIEEWVVEIPDAELS